MASPKLEVIQLFDGIAIFLIVLTHQLIAFSNGLTLFGEYFGELGLALFTWSAGYKLILNHLNNLGQRRFLGEYFFIRFLRLYKPYIGYSLLILPPILVILYIKTQIPQLSSAGIESYSNLFQNLHLNTILGFLTGDNLLAIQLWYLIALLGVTSICFTVLYFKDLQTLFLLFLPFSLLPWLVSISSTYPLPPIVRHISSILPYFIFGLFWGYNRHTHQTKMFQVAQKYLPFLFLLIPLTIFLDNPVSQQTGLYIGTFLFPFFLDKISSWIQRIKLLASFLMFCGAYSFQIYLLHLPFISSVVTKVFVDILKINFFFMPILLTIFTIYACFFVYKILKIVNLNMLFESSKREEMRKFHFPHTFLTKNRVINWLHFHITESSQGEVRTDPQHGE